MNVLPIYKMSIYDAFLVFIIFSVIGWVCEVIFVWLFVEHRFVNRGFLHGPLCPIYGVGGLVILLLPSKLYSTWLPLFFSSMILCSVVEYISSWILEKLFHTLWWDYSNIPLNINGRVCLINSVLFGFMGLFVIHFAMPYIMSLLDMVDVFWAKRIALLILVVLLVDLFFTLQKLVDFKGTLQHIKEFGEYLKIHYGNEDWFKNNSLSDLIATVKQQHQLGKKEINSNLLKKLDKIQEKHPVVENFIHKFPTLKSRKYPESLQLLKNKFLKESRW